MTEKCSLKPPPGPFVLKASFSTQSFGLHLDKVHNHSASKDSIVLDQASPKNGSESADISKSAWEETKNGGCFADPSLTRKPKESDFFLYIGTERYRFLGKSIISIEEAEAIFNSLSDRKSGNYTQYFYYCHIIRQLKSEWTLDETYLLQWTLSDWEKIATLLPTRLPHDCINKWSSLQEKDKGDDWSAREDAILMAQVRHLGTNHWNEIARNLNSLFFQEEKHRTGKQCYDRWTEVLNVQECDRTQLPLYEKLNLCLIWMKVGNRWSEISKLMGVSEGRLKWCWKSMLKEKGIKVNNFCNEGLKLAVRRVISQLKEELASKKESPKQVLKPYRNIKSISSALEPIDESPHQLNNLDPVFPAVSFGNILDRKRNPRRFSESEVKDTECIIPPNKEETKGYSNNEEVKGIEDAKESLSDSYNNGQNTPPLCDLSFKERLTTEADEYDFALGTEENVEGEEDLPVIMKVRNYSKILTARMQRKTFYE